MADIYSGWTALGSLSAGYRMVAGSGANAGGYVPVSWFAYRDASGIYQVGGQLGAATGSAALPGISFSSDLNTGIFSTAGDTMGFSTGGVERARLTSTGLGLGTSSPYCLLNVVAGLDSVGVAVSQIGGAAGIGVDLLGGVSVIPAARVHGFIAAGDSSIGINGDLLIAPRTTAACNIRFLTGSGGAQERARIDSSGNFGLGANSITALFGKTLQISDGTANATLSLVGTTAQFYIGTTGTTAILMARVGTDLLLGANNGTQMIIESAGGAMRPVADNARTLGTSSFRFSTIYAGTGTINTSDATNKLWRGAPTAAELRAGKRIASELGFYQWLDKIAEVGAENARFHFGVRAQAVWAIMADEGLVDPLDEDGRPGATPYAFLCWDEWGELTEPEYVDVEIPEVIDEESGDLLEPARVEQQPTGGTIVTREAGSRFGIRPDQLALFLIAAQEARIAALEAAA